MVSRAGSPVVQQATPVSVVEAAENAAVSDAIITHQASTPTGEPANLWSPMNGLPGAHYMMQTTYPNYATPPQTAVMYSYNSTALPNYYVAPQYEMSGQPASTSSSPNSTYNSGLPNFGRQDPNDVSYQTL